MADLRITLAPMPPTVTRGQYRQDASPGANDFAVSRVLYELATKLSRPAPLLRIG